MPEVATEDTGHFKANDPHDIAVFLLDSPVEDVKPAALPEADALKASQVKGSTFTTVGYGVVRETNRKGWQSFTDGWRGEKVDQHLNSVTKAWATFSMNLATGNGGTCFGDSGGPHFLGDVVVSITVGGDADPVALRKAAKQVLWIAFALWTGFTFVGYFTPITELAGKIATFSTGSWETFWVLFYGGATYVNAGYMRFSREQRWLPF